MEARRFEARDRRGSFKHGRCSCGSHRTIKYVNVFRGYMLIHQMIFDPEESHTSVSEYDLSGFDHTRLWHCSALQVDSLRDVVLTVRRRKENPDVLDNPLSWWICSHRMAS